MTNSILLDRDLDAHLESSISNHVIIIPPVKIGKDSKITNSIIGPHVTIGDHAQIEGVIIKDAIIGNYTILDNVTLHNSIIGNDAVIKGRSQSYNIGDNTEIDMA